MGKIQNCRVIAGAAYSWQDFRPIQSEIFGPFCNFEFYAILSSGKHLSMTLEVETVGIYLVLN